MTTRHTHRVVFGRRVDDCPRCVELDGGAEPVRWVREARPVDVGRHRCGEACGYMCTFGDW